MAEHLRRVTSRETYVHYLGKRNQNEIIELMGPKIKGHILKEVQEWTYYSIIVDWTADVSHTEQISLVSCSVSSWRNLLYTHGLLIPDLMRLEKTQLMV